VSDILFIVAKGKRLTVRVDDELDALINQACIDSACDKTAVVIAAIKKGLEMDEGVSTRKPVTYYLHKSNPNIKLVQRIYENGETRYTDTEGKKWIMNKDRTLTPIATIHVTY